MSKIQRHAEELERDPDVDYDSPLVDLHTLLAIIAFLSMLIVSILGIILN